MGEVRIMPDPAERLERLQRGPEENLRRTFTIRFDVGGEKKASLTPEALHTMFGPIHRIHDEPAREPVCDLGFDSASILHDLRNPLAAIHVAAQVMLHTDLPAHIKRLASNICNSSQRIQELLQDMFDLSRGVIGATEICCLHEVTMAACESLSDTAESYGTRLVVEIQAGIELPLQRGRMVRAFVNLILNAIEAMPGGGEVRISAERDDDSVAVYVDDTGPGIAPEIQPEIFSPYVTRGKRNGVGLGLSFVRQTVFDHGGDLWVESSPCGGARFSLTLPGSRRADR